MVLIKGYISQDKVYDVVAMLQKLDRLKMLLHQIAVGPEQEIIYLTLVLQQSWTNELFKRSQ